MEGGGGVRKKGSGDKGSRRWCETIGKIGENGGWSKGEGGKERECDRGVRWDKT